jgi:vancomycin resistance protein YoaR
MIDRTYTRIPVADFALPPHPPAPAKKAIDNFKRVSSEWKAIRGAIAQTTAEAEAARDAAKKAAVDAATSGKKSAGPGVAEVQAEYDAKLAALEDQEAALREALDQVGNELAVQVATCRGEWLANTEKYEGDAAQKYAQAISEARAALKALTDARGAVEYLSTFNHNLARVGSQRQFVGGKITVEYHVPGVIQNSWDPAVLLEGAAQVTS